MGRRRAAVYVFGTGEPVMSDCPGTSDRARYGKKPPHPPISDQAEASAGGGAGPLGAFRHRDSCGGRR